MINPPGAYHNGGGLMKTLHRPHGQSLHLIIVYVLPNDETEILLFIRNCLNIHLRLNGILFAVWPESDAFDQRVLTKV